jgi:uracil permease
MNSLNPVSKTILGVQFLFVAFGAVVLVPLLVGLNPSTALFSAGVGTLIFHLITKGKVPIFLGSSFAFIAPIVKSSELYGMPGTLFGLIGVGLVYFLVSFLIKWRGISLIKRLFPPVVIGPVIILIGLSLAGSGVNMAKDNWLLALISLITAIAVSIFGKGLFKLVGIFSGIIVGFIVAVCMGLVDFSTVVAAPWLAWPEFVKPEISWEPFLFMIPVAIAPVIEHIGDMYTISTVANKDFIKDPGLHRTMLGDGAACVAAALLGGPPVTTYSEVTGAVSLTKITDPSVIRIAAFAGIVFSVIGKINALLKVIPTSVLGGIMLLLFGTIASVGINNLIHNRVNLTDTRNMVIVSLILTFGIGGASFDLNGFTFTGIGLSAIIGVVLNLILPETKEEKKKE